MSRLRVAPAELLQGDDAVAALARWLGEGAGGHGTATGAPGAPTVLLVHGQRGYPVVHDRLDAALAAAGVRTVATSHEGPCHLGAIERLAAAAGRTGALAVLGVGGGRVLDAAKGAAQRAGRPFAALPTSPATCAATAPTVVLYDERGAFVDALEDGPPVAACALDAGLLASAPDRLLAAGILDAWAKVHEVRLTTSGRPRRNATTRAALALVDDLDALLRAHARDAIEAGPAGAHDDARLPLRRLVAEAVVAYPGLIGGLAGPDAKFALAHPLHDALTHLPGAHAALHGELVGFGTLVQLRLAGRDVGHVDDAARRTAMRVEAAAYRELGVACHLEALGCADARSGATLAAVVQRILADPLVGLALPWLGAEELVTALLEVDAWGRGLAAGRTPTGDGEVA